MFLDEEFPLRPGDVVVDLGIDLPLDLQDVVFRIQEPDQFMEKLAHSGLLKDLLLDIDALKDIRCDVERFPLRVFGVLQRDEYFTRHVPVQMDIFPEERRRVPQERIDLRVHFRRTSRDRQLRFEVFPVWDERRNGGLDNPVHKNLHQAVGELQDLDDLRNGPLGIDVVGTRFFGDGIPLGRKEDVLLLLQGLVHGFQR